jgi:uncharacterized membrane-anchored protein
MRDFPLFAAIRLAAALACLVASAPAHAQSTPAQSTPAANSREAREAEQRAAWQAADAVAIRGPADVTLLDQALLKLPARDVFVPKAEAARIMRALGNTINEATFVGIVVGLGDDEQWIVVVRHIKEGYIKDDDAKNWDRDELLKNLKEGTEEANEDRRTRGFSELEVLGWVEPPAYDAQTHRLVWSLSTKTKGEPDTQVKGINYNTYALGRDGYFSLNLLTDSSRIDRDKAVAHELLGDLGYNSGKRYEDFNASTDHIAEYGLAALIGGIALKKLGLFALIGAFVLKFAKVIAIGALALGAGAVKIFRRKPAA